MAMPRNVSANQKSSQRMLGNQREMAIHTARSPMGSPRNVLGATQDGKDWAMAALDPCAPEAPMSVGLPDTITAAVVTPNYRGEHTLTWRADLFLGSDADGMKSWGVQIVQLPVPEIAYMYRLHNETNNKWSTWEVSRTPGFELPTDNLTTLTTSQCTLRSKGYQKARVIGAGMTIELDASALNNQGRIVSGQLEIAAERADHTILTMTSPGNTSAARLGGGDVSTEWHYVVPNSKDYVVSACPRAYQGLAKDGCYIVNKFDGPLLGYDFTETGDDGFWRVAAVSDVHPAFGTSLEWLSLSVSDDPDTGLTASDAEFNAYSSIWNFLPNGVVVPWSEYVSTHMHPFVSAPSRMLTSVTFVAGLAGADASTGYTPSLRIKRRMFLECLANAGAGVAPFAHPAPLWDLDAINKVVLVMQQYDDAYPASYNDFGDILGTIWNGLKSVGETVGNVWNNVVKPIGNVIETGVGLAGLF